VKKFFVESLTPISRAHRQEDVATNELMDDFTVCREALKRQVFVVKRHVELLELPVD